MTGTALVVEDHPLYRDALSHVLQRIFGADGVRTASTAEEGLKAAASSIAELRLVLLDPGLPGLQGCEAIAAFRRALPQVAVVAISASDDRREAAAALRCGAAAFVSKAASTEVVSEVVRRVLSGELKEPLWISGSGAEGACEAPAEDLTPRQVEILALLCQGHPNKEIGLRLGLAEVTVKMHVSSVFKVLGVANRTQAVLEARRRGLYSAG
jgi:DNA-binding NarL/FixJ family response regulator